ARLARTGRRPGRARGEREVLHERGHGRDRARGGGRGAGGRDAGPPRLMRTVRIHDTLSGGVRPLEPRDDARVGIYACGPTVYAPIHVGNARPYVVFSLLKRFLEGEGYAVTYRSEEHTSELQSPC